MKKYAFLTALVALLITSSTVSAQTDIPTAEEVLKKYVELTGGVENYKKIKSMQAVGDFEIPQAGINGSMMMSMKMPNQVSIKIDIPGIGKTIQGTNGDYTWVASPMMGNRLIEGSEAEQVKEQLKTERYTNPAGFYKSMENKGIKEVGGKKVYEIALVKKSGAKQTDFYDVESGYLVRQVQTVEAAGMGEITVNANLSGYKKSGNFIVPFKMQQEMPGGMTQNIEFEKFEYNVEIADKEFAPTDEIQKMIDKKEAKN